MHHVVKFANQLFLVFLVQPELKHSALHAVVCHESDFKGER